MCLCGCVCATYLRLACRVSLQFDTPTCFLLLLFFFRVYFVGADFVVIFYR